MAFPFESCKVVASQEIHEDISSRTEIMERCFKPGFSQLQPVTEATEDGGLHKKEGVRGTGGKVGRFEWDFRSRGDIC